RKLLTLDEIKEELIKAVRDPHNIDHKKIKAIHAQLKAESEGLGEIPKELKLGLQTKEQPNIERKRFQNDTSLCCLFTFGAGKEGISLHQFLETMRPRKQYNTPTYNEMEMLQAE